jgi:hypothetical protein
MNLHLHIERLILEGLPAEVSQGELVRTAVESELARLLASGQLSVASGALAHVRAPAVRLTSKGNSTELGQQIGRALHRALRQFSPGAAPLPGQLQPADAK